MLMPGLRRLLSMEVAPLQPQVVWAVADDPHLDSQKLRAPCFSAPFDSSNELAQTNEPSTQ